MNTDEKQLSYELTEEDHEGLFSILNTSTIVSITDAKGDIIYINQKFVDISKYSPEEIIGQNHRILKSGYTPDAVYANLWKTITTGDMWRGEIKNKAKDGSFYWVDTLIAPIKGDDGKPKKYISLRMLITERKLGEESLAKRMKESEKMNKFMVEREMQMIELKEKIKTLESKIAKISPAQTSV